MKKRIKVFADFDGTVTSLDVGDLFFSTFTDGKALEPIRLWEKGEIDSREMYLRELELLQIIPEELESFLNDQKIDPAFPLFVRWCEARNISVTILSDGMDLYIRPILQRNHLDHLTVYSNELRWNRSGKLEAIFPFYEMSCGRCANCKGSQIRRLREQGDLIVFIGDGLSDLCAVPEADLIFAKDALATYCERQAIDFVPFDSFKDILIWFQKRVIEEEE